ncbi:hypothetical protein [Streptomyces sp. NPDC055189]
MAASGGTAVIAAAGTDAWGGLRTAVASWFGRSDTERELEETRRLDETAAALLTREAAENGQLRVRLQEDWQNRFALALGNLSAAERDQAAEQLRAVLAAHMPGHSPAQGPGSVTIEGDATFNAEGGSVGAAVINGGVRISPPQGPSPSRG